MPGAGQWRYRLAWTVPGQSVTTYFVQQVIDPPEGAPTGLHVRAGLDGKALAYMRDADAIWQVGTMESPQDVLRMLPQRVLLLPTTPEPGRSWETLAKPLLLTKLVATINAGQASLAAADSFLRPITTRYEVKGVGVSLNLPDPRFADCVHVVGHAEEDLVGAPQFGKLKLIVEEQSWHCRGVGLVRLSREEGTDRPWADRLSLEMTLERFD